jgi:hypothetical protein
MTGQEITKYTASCGMMFIPKIMKLLSVGYNIRRRKKTNRHGTKRMTFLAKQGNMVTTNKLVLKGSYRVQK